MIGDRKNLKAFSTSPRDPLRCQTYSQVTRVGEETEKGPSLTVLLYSVCVPKCVGTSQYVSKIKVNGCAYV